MNKKTYQFTVAKDSSSARLDKFLAENLKAELISRERIKKAIIAEQVLVNNQIITSNKHKLAAEDQVELTLIQETRGPILTEHVADLNVIYEDDDLLVINKPAGLTVHPGAGHHQDTLLNILLASNRKLSTIGGAERPGIVHRLDKNTSGLLVVAKNDEAHLDLSRQLAERSLTRKYLALVWGMLKPEQGEIDLNIARSSTNRKLMSVVREGGKTALTYYQTLEIFQQGKLSLVECSLATGRTHQIRVHLSHLGHSIFGDPEYGHQRRKLLQHFKEEEATEQLFNFKRQALQAYKLAFIHPRSKEECSFAIDVDPELQQLIDFLTDN